MAGRESMDSKDRFDKFEYRPLHVRVIRDRTSDGHITGPPGRHALLHQGTGVDQESGTDSFLQSVVSQVADLLPELDETSGDRRIHPRLTLNHHRFDVRRRIVEFNRHESLFRTLLQIFDDT